MKKIEKTMKKSKVIVGIILILAIMISLYPRSYADLNPTLENVARIFLNCTSVNEYNQNNNTMNLYVTTAKSVENGTTDILTVHVYENYVETASLVYKLEGSTLTGEFSGLDDRDETARERAYWPVVTNILIDCIEQIHGYAEGEMFDTLNSSQIANYRLGKEGLQIINNSPNYYSVQIDISRSIPTIDENSFIKVKDLEDVKDNLSGDGIAKLKKGNVLFYKCTIDDKDVISIGEQGDFSYKINKSIYSILEVMLGNSEAVDYYKENYPTVKSNKQFEGFKIEVNPVKNSTEGSVFGVDDTYKFVRITVDREAINTALENAKKKEEEEKTGEGDDGGIVSPGDPISTPIETPISETPVTGTPITEQPGTISTTGSAATTTTQNSNNGTLPKTGEDDNVILTSLYVILISAWGGIMIISAKSRKKKN